jgi:transposase InsO family protein
MAYTINPHIINVRRGAVNLVLFQGWTTSKTARYIGVHRTTVWRWLQLPGVSDQRYNLVNRSSCPHHHPRQLKPDIIERILALREQLQRCAYIIWTVLTGDGLSVSLSSVGRVLARAGLTSSWYGQPGKIRRKRIPRPYIKQPGDLVQLDAIHFANWKTKQRYYVYTLIDIKSRWSYAAFSNKLTPELSAIFVKRAMLQAGFLFRMIQTDNGQEFSRRFEELLNENGVAQRRIRLGRKNDNAHIERFNRTIQDECLGRWPNPLDITSKLEEWLVYYNTKRLHCSLQGKTPQQVLQRF